MKNLLHSLFGLVVLTALLSILGCEDIPDKSLTLNAYPPYNQRTNMPASVFDHFKWVPVIDSNTTRVRIGTFHLDEDGGYTKINEQHIDEFGTTLDLTRVPKGSNYVYIIETFGRLDIPMGTLCTANKSPSDCDDLRGETCVPITQTSAMCFRSIGDNFVAARGISAPVNYDGKNKYQVDIPISLVNHFGLLSVVDATSDKGVKTSTMKSARTGHEAMTMPDGKVVVLGGELKDESSASTFPQTIELFDPDSSTFAIAQATGWTQGRSAFSLTPLTPKDGRGRFVIAGGRMTDPSNPSRSIQTNEVLYGEYADGKLSFTSITAQGAVFEARYEHSATLLPGDEANPDDDKVLIVGGRAESGPVGDVWLVDPAAKTLQSVQISGADFPPRSKHTTSYMFDNYLIVAGGEDRFELTTPLPVILEMGDNPLSPTATVTLYEASKGEVYSTLEAQRAGHIAIPLVKRDSLGTAIAAQVLLYGGYQRIENNDGFTNINKSGSGYIGRITLMTPASDPIELSGKVSAIPIGTQVDFPCIDSKWVWMGSAKNTVLVTGGRMGYQNNDAYVYSDLGVVLSFEYDEAEMGFGRVEFRFGPDSENHKVETPFNVSTMFRARVDHAMSVLKNNQILVLGGQAYWLDNNNAAQYSYENSVEVFNPPSYNRWGGGSDEFKLWEDDYAYRSKY